MVRGKIYRLKYICSIYINHHKKKNSHLQPKCFFHRVSELRHHFTSSLRDSKHSNHFFFYIVLTLPLGFCSSSVEQPSQTMVAFTDRWVPRWSVLSPPSWQAILIFHGLFFHLLNFSVSFPLFKEVTILLYFFHSSFFCHKRVRFCRWGSLLSISRC